MYLYEIPLAIDVINSTMTLSLAKGFCEGLGEVLADRGLRQQNMDLPYATHLPGAQPVLKPDLQSEVLDLIHICQASVCCLWKMTKYSDLTPSLLLVTSFCCDVDTGTVDRTNRQ